MTLKSYSQTASSIEPICGTISYEDAPDYTYFMDLNQQFDNYIGTWVYTNNSEIVTFELIKVSQKYFPEKKIFKDFMIGNYSYSTNGGSSFVVNTITNIVNSDPDANLMYTSCIEDGKLIFIFRDVILNKKYCYVTFEFLNGSTTQMNVKIENPKEMTGSINGTSYNYNFTLPIELILTKK